MRLEDLFDNSQIIVSRVSDDDVVPTRELINHAFSYQDKIKGEKRITIDRLREKIAETEFYVWKDEAGDVVACVYVELLQDRLHFGLFSVADLYRGKGLAQEIMRCLEDYALTNGKHTMELDYMSISPWLKGYYERYGYKETGEVEDIGWSKLIRMEKALAG